MRNRIWMCLLMAALAVAAPTLRADAWDEGADNDNDSGTDNELVHGLDQVHDLAAQVAGIVEDVDWYHFQATCNNSYEVVLDGVSGDVANTTLPALEWLASNGTTILGSASSLTGFGVARRIGGLHCFGPGESANYIRVSHPLCGVNCNGSDRYHIRFYDTTVLVPRFNNTNGQFTVLILQNSTAQPVDASLIMYDSTGAQINLPISLTLNPRAVSVVNLATVDGGFLNNKSGAVTIMNDAPYGALAGKAVALEPATGFTFDTPLVYKAH